MTIKEVSEQYQLSYDTLRYYEKIGILGPISKDTSGQRSYQEKDLVRIHFIVCMKKAGLTLQAIQHYIALNQLGDQTKSERLHMLESQYLAVLNEMDALKKTADYLKQKIERYKSQ